jgi:hypothetical protein
VPSADLRENDTEQIPRVDAVGQTQRLRQPRWTHDAPYVDTPELTDVDIGEDEFPA